MLEALHFTAAGQRKGSHALPAEYDGMVNQDVLHQAVRTYLNNQRHGTAATKTRGFVSGGNQKPWRQKGTGRARQGSSRAPHSQAPAPSSARVKEVLARGAGAAKACRTSAPAAAWPAKMGLSP